MDICRCLALHGFGLTFYSGALEAWLVDALHSVGEEGGLDHVFARAQQFTGAAMLAGTTSGGFLGQIDLGVPFAVRAALLAGLFVVRGGPCTILASRRARLSSATSVLNYANKRGSVSPMGGVSPVCDC